MKKSLIIILFITSCTFASYAQLEKGTWLTGGSGSFYSYSQEYNSQFLNQTKKFTEINLDGTVGYFALEKLSIGMKTSFRYFKGDNGTITSPTRFLYGPNIRYYFLKPDKPFNILTDFTYQFGIFKNISSVKDNYKGKTNSFSAMAGTEVFFNEIAGLELLFGYKQSYEESIRNNPNELEYSDKRNGLFLSIGFKLHLKNK